MPAEDSWIAAPKLGAVRDAKLWSQYELAKRSGVSRNTINRLEAGKKAQRRTIRALAEALGVEASALLAEPG